MADAMRGEVDVVQRYASRVQRGQASVEYALLVLAFMSMLLAMAGLWRAGRDGLLLRQATSASSHQVGSAGGNGEDDLY